MSNHGSDPSGILALAKNALDSGDYQEAERYANRFIESYPQAAGGWLFKGCAQAMNITNPNAIKQSAHTLKNSLNLDRRLDSIVKSTMQTCVVRCLDHKIQLFGTYINDRGVNDIKDVFKAIVEALDTLKPYGAFFLTEGIMRDVSEKMMNTAIIAATKATNDFGVTYESRTDRAFSVFLDRMSSCVNVLDLAYDYTIDSALKNAIARNVCTMLRTIIDSCSFTRETTTRYDFWTNYHYNETNWVVNTKLSDDTKQYLIRLHDEWARKANAMLPNSQ